MSIYENNLRMIHNKKMYDELTETEYVPSSNVVIDTAKNGEAIIAYVDNGKTIYLNSKYNPQNEIERFFGDELAMPDESVITMYGLANGGFAGYFLSNNKSKLHCIVYEPSIDIFMSVMHNIDLTDILKDERLVLIVKGINESELPIVLSDTFRNHNKNTNKHIILNRYSELFPNELKELQDTINERYDKLQIEKNTMLQVGKRCVENNIKNLRHVRGCRCGNDMIGLFPQDMPAIVVASGPSLSKNISLIKEAKGKAFIFSTDSAYDVIAEQGIEPDMIASVDFAKPVKFFQGKNISNIPFMADVDLNYEVLDLINPEYLMFGASDSKIWTNLFDKVGINLPDMAVGGSVATFIIANLVQWGFKKIILIGQDLAFTGNKIHARDDDDEKIEIDEFDYTYVEGIDGDMLPVRKDYFQYLRWIEDLGYSNKDIEIIDATEGGSRKKNTTIMTFREAIDTYCQRSYDIAGILNSLPKYFEKEQAVLVDEVLNKSRKNLEKLKDRLINSKDYCNKGARILESGKYNVNELRKINSYIAQTDSMFVESDEIVTINKYIAEAEYMLGEDMYVQEKDPIKESIRMYKKGGMYYNELAKVIPEIISIIDQNLKLM